MVCKTPHMETKHLDNTVATNVTAAITRSGRSEASIARGTGIALTSLRRKLAGLNGASFTVGDLARIATELHEDVPTFFTVSA
jgi:hypothetical protein